MTRGLNALLLSTALLLGAPDLAAQAAATPTSPQWAAGMGTGRLLTLTPPLNAWK